MIVLQNQEKLRRRLPGKLKKFGKGTFYITNQRICFEHEKHGLCFDLGLNHLCYWRIKGKRTIQFKWQEHTPHQVEGFNRLPTNAEPEFDCEIEFDRKNFAGIEIQAKHVAMALYLASVNYWPNGMRTMGYWTDSQGRIWNLFDADGKAKPIINNEPKSYEDKEMIINCRLDQELHDLGCTRKGCQSDCPELTPEDRGMIPPEGTAGSTLLEQEIYEFLQRNRYESRNEIRSPNGRDKPESLYGIQDRLETMKTVADGYNGRVVVREKNIKKYEAEGNIEELQKVIPAGNVTTSISWPCPEGTIREKLTHQKKLAKIFTRAEIVMRELLKNNPDVFGTPGAFKIHKTRVLRALSDHLKAGNDIEHYTPEIKTEKRVFENYLTNIVEYRKRLTEEV